MTVLHRSCVHFRSVCVPIQRSFSTPIKVETVMCRMIKNGGVYKNNAKVADAEEQVAEGDLIDGRLLLLAAGKKNKLVVRVTS